MGLTIAQLQDDGYVDGYFDKSKQNKEITLDTLNEAYPKASKRKNDDEALSRKLIQVTKVKSYPTSRSLKPNKPKANTFFST